VQGARARRRAAQARRPGPALTLTLPDREAGGLCTALLCDGEPRRRGAPARRPQVCPGLEHRRAVGAGDVGRARAGGAERRRRAARLQVLEA
jgi:hypothetical protein